MAIGEGEPKNVSIRISFYRLHNYIAERNFCQILKLNGYL